MNASHLLDTKRRGGTHSQEEINALVRGMQDGTIADYQVSAWLMAACINGLTLEETAYLTQAFVDSGDQLDLSQREGVFVDKHSTGGVGDKTTLIVAPLLAAAGVKVAKLSGRGLGFTGGTIDKLEAIPGFQTQLSTQQFLDQLDSIGLAISSQTSQLAPADATMYALRDVTATVDSIALIAASVVSKKIASGASTIVLDIKCGRGAFMKTLEEAQQLASTCRSIGQQLGRTILTVISSMEEPLGLAVGHSVEIAEVIQTLKGEGPKDLEALCLTLAGLALVGAGHADSIEAAEDYLRTLLTNGKALDKFKALIQSQGGDIDVLDDPSMMPQPERINLLLAKEAGIIQHIDSLKVAQTVKLLGGGRQTKLDTLNLGVGVVLHKKVGDTVEAGETIAELYAAGPNCVQAKRELEEAIHIGIERPQQQTPLLLEVFKPTNDEHL